MDLPRKYWPFDVLPPEKRTAEHKAEIRFFEQAYSAGWKPYLDHAWDLCADAESGRSVIIVVRGRTRWELMLFSASEHGERRFLDDLGSAVDAALKWLGGGDATQIIESIREHITTMPAKRPLIPPAS